MSEKVDWMPEARQMAAQCWCDDETSGKEMDAVLAEAVARRIAAWMNTAAEYSSNADYWRGRVKELEAELKFEEQRIADLMGDINRQGHELAALKAGAGEPVAMVVWDGTPEGGVSWLVNQGEPLKPGQKLYTSPAIPEGWQIVPKGPTKEMEHIAMMNDSPSYRVNSLDLYMEMLAAAPKYGEKE